jgi:hypothetical protein
LSFSPSTFTLEINGEPTLVFQTKWQRDADELCRDWVKSHWDELVSRDRYGNDLPSILKVCWNDRTKTLHTMQQPKVLSRFERLRWSG